jgi:vacuolar-type H+-ATPase subunit E/Vma4
MLKNKVKLVSRTSFYILFIFTAFLAACEKEAPPAPKEPVEEFEPETSTESENVTLSPEAEAILDRIEKELSAEDAKALNNSKKSLSKLSTEEQVSVSRIIEAGHDRGVLAKDLVKIGVATALLTPDTRRSVVQYYQEAQEKITGIDKPEEFVSSLEQKLNSVNPVESIRTLLNDPPLFVDPAKKFMAREGTSWRDLVQVVDPENDSLNIRCVSGCPLGLDISPLTGEMKLFPSFSSAGEYKFTVEASDGNKKISNEFSLVVENTNRVPVALSAIVKPQIKKVVNGNLLDFPENSVFAGHTLACDSETLFQDPDGDQLVYSYSWLLNGNAASGSENSNILGSALKRGDVVHCKVNVIEKKGTGPLSKGEPKIDSLLSEEKLTSASVIIQNTSPRFIQESVVLSMTNLVDETTIVLEAEDIDGDILEYSLVSVNGVSRSSLNGIVLEKSTGELKIRPLELGVGDISLRFQAKEVQANDSKSATSVVTLSIKDGVLPPSIQTVSCSHNGAKSDSCEVLPRVNEAVSCSALGLGQQETLPLSYSYEWEMAVDLESPWSKLSASEYASCGAGCLIVPAKASRQQLRCVSTATNRFGKSATRRGRPFGVLNTAPSFSSPPKIKKQVSLSETIDVARSVNSEMLSCDSTVSDVDDNTVSRTYTWQSSSDNIIFSSVDGARDLTNPSFFVTKNVSHSYLRCVVSANDGFGGTRVAISNSIPVENTPPTWDATPISQVIREKASFGTSVKAMDLDGDEISYSCVGCPAGLSLNRTNGSISWTPVPDSSWDKFFWDITLYASDGRTLISHDFRLTVDRFPFFRMCGESSPSPVVAIPGSPTPSESLALDAWNQQQQTLRQCADTAPRIPHPSVNNGATFVEGIEYTFPLRATDPDGHVLSYSCISGCPQELGLKVNEASGLVTWKPDYGIAGASGALFNFVFQVSSAASGGNNLTASIEIPVQLLKGNRPPEIIPPASTSISVFENGHESASFESLTGRNLSFVLQATDRDSAGDVRYYCGSGCPTGLRVDEFSGEVSWTPDYNAAKPNQLPYVVNFYATDGQASTYFPAFSIVVRNVDRPPVLEDIPARSVAELSLLTGFLRATDPDGDALSIKCNGCSELSGFEVNKVQDGEWQYRWTPDQSYSKPNGDYRLSFSVESKWSGEQSSPLDDTKELVLVVGNVDRGPEYELTTPAVRRLTTFKAPVPAQGQSLEAAMNVVCSDPVTGEPSCVIEGNKYSLNIGSVDMFKSKVFDPSNKTYPRDADGDLVKYRCVRELTGGEGDNLTGGPCRLYTRNLGNLVSLGSSSVTDEVLILPSNSHESDVTAGARSTLSFNQSTGSLEWTPGYFDAQDFDKSYRFVFEAYSYPCGVGVDKSSSSCEYPDLPEMVSTLTVEVKVLNLDRSPSFPGSSNYTEVVPGLVRVSEGDSSPADFKEDDTLYFNFAKRTNSSGALVYPGIQDGDICSNGRGTDPVQYDLDPSNYDYNFLGGYYIPLDYIAQSGYPSPEDICRNAGAGTPTGFASLSSLAPSSNDQNYIITKTSKDSFSWSPGSDFIQPGVSDERYYSQPQNWVMCFQARTKPACFSSSGKTATRGHLVRIYNKDNLPCLVETANSATGCRLYGDGLDAKTERFKERRPQYSVKETETLYPEFYVYDIDGDCETHKAGVSFSEFLSGVSPSQFANTGIPSRWQDGFKTRDFISQTSDVDYISSQKQNSSGRWIGYNKGDSLDCSGLSSPARWRLALEPTVRNALPYSPQDLDATAYSPSSHESTGACRRENGEKICKVFRDEDSVKNDGGFFLFADNSSYTKTTGSIDVRQMIRPTIEIRNKDNSFTAQLDTSRSTSNSVSGAAYECSKKSGTAFVHALSGYTPGQAIPGDSDCLNGHTPVAKGATGTASANDLDSHYADLDLGKRHFPQIVLKITDPDDGAGSCRRPERFLSRPLYDSVPNEDDGANPLASLISTPFDSVGTSPMPCLFDIMPDSSYSGRLKQGDVDLRTRNNGVLVSLKRIWVETAGAPLDISGNTGLIFNGKTLANLNEPQYYYWIKRNEVVFRPPTDFETVSVNSGRFGSSSAEQAIKNAALDGLLKLRFEFELSYEKSALFDSPKQSFTLAPVEIAILDVDRPPVFEHLEVTVANDADKEGGYIVLNPGASKNGGIDEYNGNITFTIRVADPDLATGQKFSDGKHSLSLWCSSGDTSHCPSFGSQQEAEEWNIIRGSNRNSSYVNELSQRISNKQNFSFRSIKFRDYNIISSDHERTWNTEWNIWTRRDEQSSAGASPYDGVSIGRSLRFLDVNRMPNIVPSSCNCTENPPAEGDSNADGRFPNSEAKLSACRNPEANDADGDPIRILYKDRNVTWSGNELFHGVSSPIPFNTVQNAGYRDIDGVTCRAEPNESIPDFVTRIENGPRENRTPYRIRDTDRPPEQIVFEKEIATPALGYLESHDIKEPSGGSDCDGTRWRYLKNNLYSLQGFFSDADGEEVRYHIHNVELVRVISKNLDNITDRVVLSGSGPLPSPFHCNGYTGGECFVEYGGDTFNWKLGQRNYGDDEWDGCYSRRGDFAHHFANGLTVHRGKLNAADPQKTLKGVDYMEAEIMDDTYLDFFNEDINFWASSPASNGYRNYRNAIKIDYTVTTGNPEKTRADATSFLLIQQNGNESRTLSYDLLCSEWTTHKTNGRLIGYQTSLQYCLNVVRAYGPYQHYTSCEQGYTTGGVSWRALEKTDGSGFAWAPVDRCGGK